MHLLESYYLHFDANLDKKNCSTILNSHAKHVELTYIYIYCTNALYSPAITSGIFPNSPHYRFNIVKTLLFQCLRHQTLNGKICCRHRGRIA